MDGSTRTFNKGDIVKHFKREINHEGNTYLYEIIGVAINSEDEEEYMVYQALYGNKRMFIRPLSMFLEEVDHHKYPNIKQKYRFEHI